MVSPVVISAVTGRVREFWAFYHRYTDTTVHTAATAALTIFGLLIFVDPWFAALAIGSYVGPPLVLYALAEDRIRAADDGQPERNRPSDHAARTVDTTRRRSTATRSSDADLSRTKPDSVVGDGDTDSDSDDGDTDFDGIGTDTDFDGAGTDTDSDGGGTDTDSDSDGTDTDSDSDG